MFYIDVVQDTPMDIFDAICFFERDENVKETLLRMSGNDTVKIGTFTVFHVNGCVINADSDYCFTVVGKTTGKKEMDLINMRIVTNHGWYAIMYDYKYEEYVRLYEDGHMTILEPQDRHELLMRGYDI